MASGEVETPQPSKEAVELLSRWLEASRAMERVLTVKVERKMFNELYALSRNPRYRYAPHGDAHFVITTVVVGGRPHKIRVRNTLGASNEVLWVEASNENNEGE